MRTPSRAATPCAFRSVTHSLTTRLVRAVLSGVAIFFGVGYGLRVACLNAAAAINEALAARAASLQAK